MADDSKNPSLILRHADDLTRLPIDSEERASLQRAAQTYNVRAPRTYLQRVRWDDPRDPVRLQIIPRADELEWDPREHADPIGDEARSPVPRLTHRYPDRVLLYPTYQCAVYCRHCFRKESLDDAGDQFTEASLEPALAYIAAHAEIREVILSGGDPLVLSNARLAWLRARVESISHVRLLRVHTRVPVVTPGRVTREMVSALKGRLMVCVVTHFNHAQEITQETVTAARTLREAGFMLLNQTVLLRGVNDTPEALRELFRELVYALGIKPYYLHHCDLTRGLTHFRTGIEDGHALMQQLRGHVSGLCVPLYVLDLPGGAGKVPLGPSYTIEHHGYDWVFRDFRGGSHSYTEVVRENPPEPK